MPRLPLRHSADLADALDAFELEEIHARRELRARRAGKVMRGLALSPNTLTRVGFMVVRRFRRLAFRRPYETGYKVVLQRGPERIRLPFA